jgi:glyoxylase-like metal-dependent hydrolase (beta-lactamase superfamily II)
LEIHPKVSEIEIFGHPEEGVPPNITFIYLIRGSKTALIDAGPDQSPDKVIAPALKKLGMALTDIDLIVNTHSHSDHSGGDAKLKKASNASILIHTDEAIFLEDHGLTFDQHWAPTVEAIKGKTYIEQEKKHFIEEIARPGSSVIADRRLKDNDIIELGEGLDMKVIHLPGHSPGSVGYYLEAEGIIFAGNATQGVCKRDGGLPIIDDLAAYEKSLERLQKMPLKVIALSHRYLGFTGPRSHLWRGEEIKKFLEACWDFTLRLREAAKIVAPDFSKRSFHEVYDEVVSRFPSEWGLKTSSKLPIQWFSATTLLNCIKQMER